MDSYLKGLTGTRGRTACTHLCRTESSAWANSLSTRVPFAMSAFSSQTEQKNCMETRRVALIETSMRVFPRKTNVSSKHQCDDKVKYVEGLFAQLSNRYSTLIYKREKRPHAQPNRKSPWETLSRPTAVANKHDTNHTCLALASSIKGQVIPC